MAVDIEGFDIVFSAANANNARAIDQSIARMSEKVPTLSMGISDMAKALETLGKLNIDGVKKNLDAVKDSIENIDGSKLNKVFDLATAKSEGLLNSVTSLVNMLGKVDLSSLRGGAKTEIYDERSRVATTKEAGNESQIPIKFDERTILSEIKNISDRLATLFKDIPVSLRKELDLTFFAEKANELKKMFAGITVTGIQPTSAKKTENTVSNPQLDAGSSRLSSDSALVIEAAFERMNNLTNALIEKIRSISTAENELFSNLRTDIQGVSTALQGLVEQLSKVQEKSTRKKSAKKEDDAIVTEREVALTKEELARLDDLNAKLAKSNDLLAKKRTEQDAIVKATGTRDMFLNDEISRLETEIKAYNKAKQDLLVPKHGVAPSQSVVETQQAENAQLKLVKEVEEEANARQKNIAYLTQMISLIERMLKYGNFGQGVDMFSGMQQYLVDVQAKMKSLLKEQRTTTEQQIAQQNKATEDMALSYLKMINVQIEAAKRKERKEQAYRERVLAAERAYHQERQKLYESLFGKGGEKDTQDAQIKKAQQWYTKDAEMRQKAEENAHNAIQILIAKAEAQRIAAKEYEDKLNEQFYEKEKKRLYDLYQEQLKLKGKIGSLDNQRTIVSERSQGTITALSPKQEQLAKEYAQQLAKVNAEISRTASLVGYVDAQNAKESTRIALLEQEIKLQKELDKALEKVYAEQNKKADAANAGLSASQIKSMENEYARLLTQIDKVNAARREMNEKQGAAWSTGNTQAFAQLSSGIQAADKELIRLNERKAKLENESQLQLDKIRETYERKRGEQAVNDFEKAEKNRIAAREASEKAEEQIYQNNKKRLYDLYQEQLKLKGKIGSIDNQRTIVSERSQGTITALSPKQEQLAKEYAQQLAKVNEEISRTASLVNYVDAQNAKESTRIALLEQEIKLQKELDKALEKIYAEQQKKSDSANAGLSASQIKSMENEYARLLVQIDKVKSAIRTFENEAKFVWRAGDSDTLDKIFSANAAADKELERLIKRKEQLENESQLQLDKIRETHERKRGEQAVKDFERAEREKTRIAEREDKKRADGYKSQNLAQNTSLTGASEFAKTANTINRLQTALKYLQDALSKTKPNTPEWNNANNVYQETKKRLDDIKKSMDGVKAQTNSIMPALKNLSMQVGLVFSVQQLNQWVQHMVEVRAQFELQQIALRSIIQDKQKADEVFAQVQQLALKSPFSIMQLNTYTKQMAAYGVEADKLVGTTKQLADVSAGLGVDMGRLILAYGQVKTANYLRATEVRQFTEAGLNITQELANYFTELNGKMVTAGEVTEMITKRMVKFEDVAEVFKRVTSAGGMFYNMQEKQSEGLQGQIQRIGDAYSIMLNQIGKNNQGLISKVLSTIRELISSWRSVSSVITVAATAAAAYMGVAKFAAIVEMLNKTATGYKLVAFATNAATAAQLKNNAAVVANPYALAAAAIALVVAGIYEWATATDQLTEDLQRMQEETFADATDSVARFTELADTVRDVTKAYSERKEAMDEIQRSYGDILPMQQLEMDGIMSISDGYKEATEAIREYYRIKLEEEQKSAIESSTNSKMHKLSSEIVREYTPILEDIGATKSSIQSILNRIIEQLKEGSITTVEEAGNSFVNELIRYYNITDKELQEELRDKLFSYNPFFGASYLFGDIDVEAAMYRGKIEEITESNENFADITEERTHAALQLINKDFEQVEERVKKVGLAFSQLDNLRTLNERAGGTGFDIAKIQTAVSDKKTGNLTAEEQKVAAALQEIEKDLVAVGQAGKYSWQQLYDATANNIAQTEWFGAVQKTAFTSFLQNLNQAKYYTNELAKTLFAEKLQAKIESVDGTPTVREIKRIVKAVADANKLDYHLFDWLTLDVKTSFESAGKEFDSQLKAFGKKLLAYKEMMSMMYVTGQTEEEILAITGLTKEQVNNSEAFKKALDILKTAMGNVDNDKKTNKTDKTEQTLRERIKLIKEANQTFEKYAKEYDKVIAKEKTYNDLMDRAKELNIADILRKDDLNNTATLEAMQNVYNKFKSLFKNKKYVGAKRDALKEMSDMKFEISVELNENNRKELQDSFDKMFGDYQLFIELDKIGINQNLAKDMFDIDYTSLDEIGARWKQLFLDKINDEYKQMDASFAGFKTYEEAKAKLSQEKSNKNYEMAVNTEKKISEAFNKELESRMKEYAKYLKKSYSESVNEQVNVYRQLRQLQMDADFKRDAINGNDKLDDKAKLTALQQLDAQSSQIAARMQEELQKKLNKIQWESFKDSPLFETVLSDIEHLSTGTIDMLIKKMEQLKDTYKGLDPKVIKELTKYIDQLTKQKIKNNPFKEFGNALREIHDLKKQGLTLDKLNAKLVSESDELTRINNEIESYNKVLAIKQQMTHVTEQDVGLMQKETKALEKQLKTLESKKQESTSGDEETKNLNLQITKIQEILAARRTILASNGDNIVLSEKELALLKQKSSEIAKQIVDLAAQKGLKEGDIEKIKKLIGNWDKLKDSQKEAITILNEVGAAASAGFSAAEAALDLFGGSSDEVTKAMMQGFDDCLQACISLTTSIIAMGEAANTASGIIGVIASALTAVASLFKAIFGVHDKKLEKSIKEHQRQVKKLEAEYDNLSDAISNAFSGFQLGTNTQAAIQNLEEQNEQYRAMIENEKDKKDSDEDQIADWEQTIKDNLKKAQELRQQYFTELGGLGSGSDVRDAAEGFVDAWSEAFGETRDGISGLKEEFDDFMKNIVKKQAYMKIADHWINKFGDMINNSFDKYGQVNYENLQSAMKWFTEEAIPQMDNALEDMNAFWERIGINWTGTTSNLSGLAAGIQGVTEETAQILEALLNSMRYYVADTNEQLRQIFVTMTNPNEENPFLKELKNQTKYLASIDKRLDSVISATKRASGSHINVFST